MMFLKRVTSEGIAKSPYYQDNKYCAFNGTSNAMPNCTAYAFARSAELSAPKIIRDYVMFNRKGADNACLWYPTTSWAKGSIPKVGAIACWNGTLGHVAVVEEVKEDGKVIVSQSNYGGTFWELKAYDLKVGETTQGVGLVFQGYIYNPFTIDKRVEPSDKEQVEVIADRLRARKKPNGEIHEGLYCPQGIYNILETSIEGAYTWAKIDEDVWIALKEGVWTHHYNGEGKTEGDFDSLCDDMTYCLSEVKRLNSELKMAKERCLAISELIEEHLCRQ